MARYTLKSRNIKIICLLVLVVAMVAYLYLDMPYAGQTTTVKTKLIETDVKIKYAFDSSSDFYVHNKNFFHGTKDGIEYLDEKGNVIWKDSYTFSNPNMISEGGYVLVTENRGKNLHVYNKSGKLYSTVVEYPILSASLNSNGYISVIAEKNENYQIIVINNLGAAVSYWEHITNNNFPIATDISNDNRILAVSFLELNNVNMVSKLVYSYIDKSEAKEKTKADIVSGLFKENDIIASVNFMEDNKIILVLGKEIICIKEDNNLNFKEEWNIPLKNKLDHINFDEYKNITIALGDTIINEDSEEVGLIKSFTLSGEKLGQYSFGKNVEYLYTGYGNIIAGANKNFTAVTKQGKILWKHNALQDVEKILFFQNKNKVILAGNTYASILKLGRAKEKVNSNENILQ